MAKTPIKTPKAPKEPKPAAAKLADGAFKVMPLHGEKAKSSGK